MVKNVLGVNHQGFRDWLIQRFSAIIMLFYTLFLISFFLCHPDVAYFEWHGLFDHYWMKILTAVVVLSLLYHAWIGMWTVYTDYIKVVWLNILLQVLTLLILIGFFIETIFILWGV